MWLRTGGIWGFVLGTAFARFVLGNPFKASTHALAISCLGRRRCRSSCILSGFFIINANAPLQLLARRHRLFCRQVEATEVLLEDYRRRIWSELLSSE